MLLTKKKEKTLHTYFNWHSKTISKLEEEEEEEKEGWWCSVILSDEDFR